MSGDELPRRVHWPRRTPAEIGADVDDELAFHVEMRVSGLVDGGMTEAEARRRVLASFGDAAAERARLAQRDTGMQRRRLARAWVGDVAQDVRFAWRGLRRAPGFAIVAILTLALGVGGNTALFSLVDGVLLRTLPYPASQELVAVWPEQTHSPAELEGVQRYATHLASIAAYEGGRPYTLGSRSGGREITGAVVSPSLWGTLRVQPILGRTFNEADAAPDAAPVAVLSQSLWRQEFGGDEDAIGAEIRLQGIPHTVIGIMGAGFTFPSRHDEVWLPLRMDPTNPRHWGVLHLQLIGRLRDATDPAAATEQVRTAAQRLRRENPLWTPDEDYGRDATVASFRSTMTGSARTPLLILLAAVGAVLLIACVNVSNLLLARGLGRGSELAVRTAMGAGRGRLLRQLLTESILLAAIGGIGGVVLAALALPVMLAALPSEMPRAGDIALNARVLLFAAAITFTAALLFGAVPAFRTVGGFTVDALRGARSGSTRAHRRLTNALIIAEVALAVVVLIGASLLLRSFWNTTRVAPGFDAEGAVVARISPPAAVYESGDRQRAFYDDVLARARQQPGVGDAALVSQLPFDGGGDYMAFLTDEGSDQMRVHAYRRVSPGFTAALGMRVLRGREFTPDDRAGTESVVMVDVTAARTFWPGQEAVGQRIRYYGSDDPPLRVIGVVNDVRNNDLTADPEPTLYLPFAQSPALRVQLVVRGQAADEQLAQAITDVVREADPAVAVGAARPLHALIADSLQRAGFTSMLLLLFGGIALLLGAIGIYGVNAYAVNRRIREMGVRMALGADYGRLMRDVVAGGAVLGLAGIAAGVGAAFFLSVLVQPLLYGVRRHDLLTFAIVPLVLLAACVIATWLPARRAARLDPVRALRSE